MDSSVTPLRVAPLRVAFCGLGQLGGPVCDLLVASPHHVAVYDPRAEAADPRVLAGARRATSPADAATDVDVVIVFVRDDAQSLDTVTGPEGVLRTARPGAVVVLHSTVAPATVRTLDAACGAVGVRFIDAGVSRGGGRGTDRLYAMCGGEQSTIDAVHPVLAVYCSDVVRFGDIGAGMTAKLIRNAMRYALWGVQYEGMTLAEAAGLDLAAMAHVYRATFGTTSDDEAVLSRATMAPFTLDNPHPDPEYVVRMSDAVTLGWKDLDGAYALADEHGIDVPMARAARALYGPALGIAHTEEDHR
jgi:3-hydroxyisobutyrate dehydrogenase-like beta-hydroxyacid dehydrogenase